MKGYNKNLQNGHSLLGMLDHPLIIYNHNGILYTNEEGVKFLGASSLKDVEGRHISDFMKYRDRQYMDQEVSDILRHHRNHLVKEDIMINMDGDEKDTERTSIQFHYKKQVCILSIFRDLTEEKELELLRQRLKKEERLLRKIIEYERLKTDFLTNISHELRTPLNVIWGLVQLFDKYLQNGTMKAEGKGTAGKINIMKDNCYRMFRIINNLIDISEMDSGTFELNLQQINIVQVIEEIVQTVASYLSKYHISIIFDTDSEDISGAFDSESVERIVLNLLSNAVKFTDPGGTVEVQLQDQGHQVVVSVKDEGPGIPAEKHEVIFERFSRLDKTFTRTHEGGGIGLSLTKSLVEMHGGNINVKSVPGRGSNFIVRLPVTEKGFNTNANNRHAGQICQKLMEKVNIEFSGIMRQ